MRFVGTIAGACIMIFTVIIGGIVGYARIHVDPQEVALRSLLDPGKCAASRVCWHGINFLVTPSDEAVGLMVQDKSLQILPPVPDQAWRNVHSDGLPGWNISVSTDGVQMDGRSNSQSVPLSAVMATFGTPRWVSTCQGNFFTGPIKFQMQFSNGFAIEALSSGSATSPELKPDMPVDFIGMGYVGFVERMTSRGSNWQGFKKWELYPPVRPEACS